MIILGISALYHDSAASIVIDGQIIASAQEERFSRIKHDQRFPINAINYCVDEAQIKYSDIDVVVFYDNPFLTLDRYMVNIAACGTDSKEVIERSFDDLFSKRLWIHKIVDNMLGESDKRKFYVCEHHISHAASAFYPSPFEKAVILTLDGVGEWTTTAIGIGSGSEIYLKEELEYPHSIGLMYSAFTYFCGFKVNSGDYKFMGLAPYGKPIYEDIIKEKIVDIKEDGSIRLNLEYFDFQNGRSMINHNFEEIFGGARRMPESPITKREMDIAASAQKVTEEIILKMVLHAKEKFGQDIDNLVMAGGVALNCVANGKIEESGIFKNIWVQPAAGDAGGSLGAALYYYYSKYGAQRKTGNEKVNFSPYLGPHFETEVIEQFLKDNNYPYYKYDDENLFSNIASLLTQEKVIGLFHGRMEFGPRALGNRSIIADARSKEMQVKLNQKIKFRESFRPFAPSVLEEDVADYFEMSRKSPYMLMVHKVRENRRIPQNIESELSKHNSNMLEIVKKERSDIPAVTHVDYSARIQTVSKEDNPFYYDIISHFKKLTGYGVIVNTSFNVRGEPIVCTPQNAYDCFMRTDMDVLVLENYLLFKEEQPEWHEKENWKELYTLD